MLDLTHLRSMFGLVGQEPVLFDATVKENILFGKQGTNTKDNQDEVHVEAAKNANAHGFVSNMPEGYDTSVGKYTVQASMILSTHIKLSYCVLIRKSIVIDNFIDIFLQVSRVLK